MVRSHLAEPDNSVRKGRTLGRLKCISFGNFFFFFFLQNRNTLVFFIDLKLNQIRVRILKMSAAHLTVGTHLTALKCFQKEQRWLKLEKNNLTKYLISSLEKEKD